MRRINGIAGTAAVLATGGGILLGAVAPGDGGADTALTGETRSRAVAAALAHTGGGTVSETATGDDGAAYEVEVRRADGSQIEVSLDDRFSVIGGEADDDGRDPAVAVRATAVARTTAATPLPRGAETVTLDPADFSTTIDNPWWPMRVGTRWIYRETSPDGTRQRVVVTVTGRTRLIANGITARVVTDRVTERGVPVEVTEDWYAQDRAGNVWYLGEATTEYEDGKPVSTAGSFEAGVDGAQAGIAMPARPRVGLRYRQEYYAGEAEDAARVLSLRQQAQVPAGHFGTGSVLTTEDVNPLQPKVLEQKFYVRGVGPVLAIGISGGADREELVRVTR